MALMGGAAFFVLWFIGAQILWLASGGDVSTEIGPNADQYPAAVLSNQSGIHLGTTLLVLAAVSLIWFAGWVTGASWHQNINSISSRLWRSAEWRSFSSSRQGSWSLLSISPLRIPGWHGS